MIKVNTMIKVNVMIFPYNILRHLLRPVRLTFSRETAKLSVEQFASKAGWTTSYQYKLESGCVLTVCQDTKDIILEVFRRHYKHYGGYSKKIRQRQENIFKNCIKRYSLNADALKVARLKTGSVRRFVEYTGWSVSYQQRLEKHNHIKTVTEEKRKTILDTLQLLGVITQDHIRWVKFAGVVDDAASATALGPQHNVPYTTSR